MKIIILSFLLLSLSLFAGEDSSPGTYKFKDRVYRLGEFVNNPPKKIIKGDFASLADVPRVGRLTSIQSPVKNQGDRGSCAHFSTTALIESEIFKKQGVVVNLSEEYLIYYSKGVLGYSPKSEGSRYDENFMAHKKGGLFLEKDMPYQASWFGINRPCKDYKMKSSSTPVSCFSHLGPTDDILDRKISVGTNLRVLSLPSNSARLVKFLALDKSAIVVGLPIHPEGWNGKTGEAKYNEKLRSDCNKNPGKCGGHSILITGYDLSKKIFYFKNSWGEDWGTKGYGYFSFEYIDRYTYKSSSSIELRNALSLPEDTLVPEAVAENVQFELFEDGYSYNVKVGADVNYLSRGMLYISTFIGYKANDQEVIGDVNFSFVKYSKEVDRLKYGSNIRATFYDQFKTDVLSYDGVEQRLLKKYIISDKELYLRTSIYVYNDITGWNVLFRKYIPVSDF